MKEWVREWMGERKATMWIVAVFPMWIPTHLASCGFFYIEEKIQNSWTLVLTTEIERAASKLI